MQVATRLSFHDKSLSLMSETSEIPHTGPDWPDWPDYSNLEMRGIRQETRSDDIGISLSDDIRIVEES